MNSSLKSTLYLPLGLLFSLALPSCAQTPDAPFWKTDFATGTPTGWTISPGDWKNKPGFKFSVETEGDTSFARFHLDTPEFMWANYDLVLPQPAPKSLRIVMRVRTKNLVLKEGAEWYAPQVDGEFHDQNDKFISNMGTSLRIKREIPTWSEREQTLDVPANAAVLHFKPGLWGGSGDFDLAELRVYAIGTQATAPVAAPHASHTFYVAPSGSDAGAGTLVKPFKTINAAAQVAQAGDIVEVRAGTYRETVVPANSGSDGAPIIYRPYRGERVVISGTEILSNWTKNGAVWTTPMAGDFFGSTMNQSDQIFVDGKMVNLARWPNTGGDISRPVKSTLTKFISKTRENNWTTAVFEDENLPDKPDGFYEGAEIVMQPNKDAWSWTFSGTIIGHKGKQLTLRSRNDNGVDGNGKTYAVGSRYYLHNTRNLLDADGEWLHDRAAGVLSLQLADNPKNHVVEAKKRDYAFNLDGKSYVTIEGFEIFGCSITTDPGSGGDAIGHDADGKDRYPWRGKGSTAAANHILLDGIKASYLNHFTDMSGHFFLQWGQNTGLVLSGFDCEVRNCQIQKSAGNGITTLGRRNRVLNNLIEDVSYNQVDNAGVSTGGAADSFDHEIAFNTIRRTGRSGILPRNLQNSDVRNLRARIHHNDISQSMLQDFDGGAIYAAGEGKWTRIDHNLCHDIEGFSGSGVYPDLLTNWIIDHNVIWNLEWGIHLQQQNSSPSETNALCYNNTILVKNMSGVPYGPFGFANGNGRNIGTTIQNNLIGVLDRAKSPGYKPISGHFEDAVKSDNHEWDGTIGSPSDPRFSSLETFDFSLRDDSPAKDAGKPIAPVIRAGITIPPFNDPVFGAAPDIGAFEIGAPRWKAGYASVAR